jgi:hypothetical protein
MSPFQGLNRPGRKTSYGGDCASRIGRLVDVHSRRQQFWPAIESFTVHNDHRAHRPPCTPDIAIADIAIADIAIARLPPSGKPRAGQS